MKGGGYRKIETPLMLYWNQKVAVDMATEKRPALHRAFLAKSIKLKYWFVLTEVNMLGDIWAVESKSPLRQGDIL